MIKGFDKQTETLSDYERNTLVPVMVRSLAGHIGKAAAITNKYICSRMRLCGYQISDARVRKIVNHIRTNGLVQCLIATSGGYYVAETEEELKEYEDSLLGREQAIREVRLSIERQRRIKYHKEPWQD